MTQQMPFSNTKLNKVMNPDQFNQVVEAILAGKYSWACVLILRFAGYNPLHYIPYRTYNRLLKDNCQFGESSRPKTDTSNTRSQCSETTSDVPPAFKGANKIKDLGHLEVVGSKTHVCGGHVERWLDLKLREYNSSELELVPQKNQDIFDSDFEFLKKLSACSQFTY